jgi:hypothetical protein
MRHRQRAACAAIVFAVFATMGTATIAARGPEHGHADTGAAPGSKGHGHECETREPHGNGQGNAGSTHGNSSHQSADDCTPPESGNDGPGTNGPPPAISFNGPSNFDQNVVITDDQQVPEQVPEPASLILVSGRLIAGVRAYRRRQSRTR